MAEDCQKAVNEHGLAIEDLAWAQEVVTGLREPTLEETLRICHKYPADQFEVCFVEIAQSAQTKAKAEHLRQWVLDRKQPTPNQEKQYPRV